MFGRAAVVSSRQFSLTARAGAPDLITQSFLKQIKDLAAKQK